MQEHNCELDYDSDEDIYPPPPPKSSYWFKIKRALHRSILINDSNPSCRTNIRSRQEMKELRLEQFLSRKWTVHPFSMFRVYYEMYMAVVYFISHFYFPFTTAFREPGPRIDSFSLVMNICYGADLIVRLMTGYWDKKRNEIIMKPGSIVKRTLLSPSFYMDILSCVPTSTTLYGTARATHAIQCLTLLKFNAVVVNLDYVHRSAQYLDLRGDKFNIFILGLEVILLLHFTSCVLFFIPQLRIIFIGDLPDDSWVYLKHIWKQSLGTRYVFSMFRAFSYIFTIFVDFNENPPWGEAVWAIVICSAGKVVVLTVTVLVTNLVMSRNMLETKYNRIMTQVQYFMIQKNLPEDLQERIMENYHYKYNGTICKENKILELLSDKLRREITREVLGRLATTVNLFKDLPKNILENVLMQLKAEIYLPNDIIIKSGGMGECMYFLASGTVSITSPSGKEVCHLQDGDYFGEVTILFKDKLRTADVIALEICEVYKMSKRGFFSCFHKNPNILKMLREVATYRSEMTEAYEDIHLRSKQA